MYQNKITLTPQDILEKDFKIDTRGYRLNLILSIIWKEKKLICLVKL